MASDLTREQFSGLIGRLYDCALAPAQWPAMMDELCRLVDGVNSAIFVLDVQTQKARFGLCQGFDAVEQDHLQNSYSSDDVFQPLLKLLDPKVDPDEPFVFLRTVSEDLRERSALRQDWSARLGIVDSIGTLVAREHNRLGIWSAARHKSVGEITDREVDIMREIAPHLRRAVTISDILDGRKIEASALGAALDSLKAAVFILGAGGRVLIANTAGEKSLNGGGPVATKAGRLVARSPASAAAFDDAIARALLGDDMIGKSGIGVPLFSGQYAGAAAYVLPLAVGEVRTRLVPQALAVVFVTGADGFIEGLEAFSALYQLTRTEARVVELLVAGRSIVEVSCELGNAEATVRTHLARVFSKTSTTRQGELVALAARMVAPAARN